MDTVTVDNDCYARHTLDELPDIVIRLREHQPAWEALGVAGRVHLLQRHRDWLRANAEWIVGLLQQDAGKSRAQASLELGAALETIDYYNAHAAEFLGRKYRGSRGLPITSHLDVDYRPCLVAAVASPWNCPLAPTLFDAVPALMAGAAVVITAAPSTSSAVHAAITGWSEIGAPAVLEAAVGDDMTDMVIETLDHVQFTGSRATGRRIAQRAAIQLVPCGLRLRGKSPSIVLADADLRAAAAGIATAGLYYSGQLDTAIERIYVQETVYDEFVDTLVSDVTNLRNDSDDTEIGTVATTAQVAAIRAQLADALAKGATCRTGGGGEGRYIEPTVLSDVDHSMTVMTEDTVGPILPVMPVPDADTAIHYANAIDSGLAASVWTRNIKLGKHITHHLQACSTAVNDASLHHRITAC